MVKTKLCFQGSVENAFADILAKAEEKQQENERNNDKDRFYSVAKDLTQWCNLLIKRLHTFETPR